LVFFKLLVKKLLREFLSNKWTKNYVRNKKPEASGKREELKN
jgi:hypothetical protein